jgi:hypothetical protein
MSLSSSQRRNFETLQRAFLAEDAALMECQLEPTGESVAVICAANRLADGAVEFVPFAAMFQDNPYEMVNPPKPGGGFCTQADQQGIVPEDGP